MPRQARKLSRTGVYHVMLRGINRQDIFEDDEDYRQMTGCLRSLTERYDEMITRTVPTILRVKSGNKLIIQNGVGGVVIEDCFECEPGAVFKIK